VISQETAGKIWNAYREIEAGEKLLADMDEAAKDYQQDVRRETVKDAFGRRRHLTLGVPSGSDCHRILDVAPSLARSVIIAHIANKKAELTAMNEQARIEIEAA
jgi:hypothetical protein